MGPPLPFPSNAQVTAKQRLVTLAGLLRQRCVQSQRAATSGKSFAGFQGFLEPSVSGKGKGAGRNGKGKAGRGLGSDSDEDEDMEEGQSGSDEHGGGAAKGRKGQSKAGAGGAKPGVRKGAKILVFLSSCDGGYGCRVP